MVSDIFNGDQGKPSSASGADYAGRNQRNIERGSSADDAAFIGKDIKIGLSDDRSLPFTGAVPDDRGIRQAMLSLQY